MVMVINLDIVVSLVDVLVENLANTVVKRPVEKVAKRSQDLNEAITRADVNLADARANVNLTNVNLTNASPDARANPVDVVAESLNVNPDVK